MAATTAVTPPSHHATPAIDRRSRHGAPQMTDETLFRRAMHALAVNFNREMDGDVLQVYWRALNGVQISDAEFAAAVTLAIRQDQHMPPIARLIALARPESDVRSEAVSVFGKIAR